MIPAYLPVSDRLDFVNNLLDKINSDGRESTSKEKIHINNPLDKISSKTDFYGNFVIQLHKCFTAYDIK